MLNTDAFSGLLSGYWTNQTPASNTLYIWLLVAPQRRCETYMWASVCWLIWPLTPALEFALAEKLDTTHFTLSACEFRNWIGQQTHTDGQIEAQKSQTRETAHRSWLDHTHSTWWTATGWTVTDCSHDSNTNGWQTCSINDVNKVLLGMEFHHAHISPYEDTSRAKCGFKQHDVSLYFLRHSTNSCFLQNFTSVSLSPPVKVRAPFIIISGFLFSVFSCCHAVLLTAIYL